VGDRTRDLDTQNARNADEEAKDAGDGGASQERVQPVWILRILVPRCNEVENRGTFADDEDDGGLMQRLRWWHAEGSQNITVKGVKRKQNAVLGPDEEEGYLEQCPQRTCVVM